MGREEDQRGLKIPSPADVLKWSLVAFAVCVEILIVVAVVLALFVAF